MTNGTFAPVIVQRTCAIAIEGDNKRTEVSVMVSWLSWNTKANAGGELALYLRAPFPPPAQDIDAIAVFGKQAGISRGVVPIPRISLKCLHLPNAAFVIR